MPVEVLNRHHLQQPWTEGCDYIGRGTPLGNPYTVEEHGREGCLSLYHKDLGAIVASQGTVQNTLIPAASAWAELLRLVRLYRLGKYVGLVCSCKPKDCHGDIVQRAIVYLARQQGVSVGDRVRHINPACDMHQWQGTVIWLDTSLTFCDVMWDQTKGAIEKKHSYKDHYYCISDDPRRYPTRLLEFLPVENAL